MCFDRANRAKTRGGVSLRHILKNIEHLRQVEKQSSRSTPLILSFHITMRKANVHELPQIVELAHQIGVTKMSGSHVAIHDPNDIDETLFSIKELSDQYCKQAIEKAHEYGIPIDFPPLFENSNYGQPNDGFNYCYPLAQEALIFGNCDVVSCCHTAARYNMVMGN